MTPIPAKLRKEMAEDPFYKACCFHRINHGPRIKIEWHHNLIYAGSQLQEKWCILPICEPIHKQADHHSIREELDWIMLNRADDETLKKYSKAVDLVAKRDRLNKRYGKWRGADDPTEAH